jgi:hypothetical protein
MKKFILLFLAILFMKGGSLKADEWEWAPEGAIWIYHYKYGYNTSAKRYIKSVGDTLIEDKVCRKLDMYLYNEVEGSIINTYLGREYACYEDSIIYHFDRFHEELYAFYDFTLNVGDTIVVRDSNKAVSDAHSIHTFFYRTHFEAKLTSITENKFSFNEEIDFRSFRFFPSNVIIGMYYPFVPWVNDYHGEQFPWLYHPFFMSETYNLDYVIENIGSSSWFFGTDNFQNSFLDGEAHYIECYSDQYGEIFFNPNYVNQGWPCEPQEALVTSLDEKTKNLSPELKVYPNPAKNALNIYIKREDGYRVHIYDMLGRIVYIENEWNYNSDYTIERNQINSGTYFLNIQFKNGDTKNTLFHFK